MYAVGLHKMHSGKLVNVSDFFLIVWKLQSHRSRYQQTLSSGSELSSQCVPTCLKGTRQLFGASFIKALENLSSGCLGFNTWILGDTQASRL